MANPPMEVKRCSYYLVGALVGLSLSTTSIAFATSNYGDCAYGALSYGGDCTPPTTSVGGGGGGGNGAIFGSGPLAPGWTVQAPTTSLATSTTTTGPKSTLPANSVSSSISLSKNRTLYDRGEDIR